MPIDKPQTRRAGVNQRHKREFILISCAEITLLPLQFIVSNHHRTATNQNRQYFMSSFVSLGKSSWIGETVLESSKRRNPLWGETSSQCFCSEWGKNTVSLLMKAFGDEILRLTLWAWKRNVWKKEEMRENKKERKWCLGMRRRRERNSSCEWCASMRMQCIR